MKKLISIFTILIISTSLVACGGKSSTATNTKTPADTKITYTKEFTYLPSYSDVKPTKLTPATKKNSFATATYTIKNTKDEKIYTDYESLLKKDGWTITEGKKYTSISAKKGTHMANIIFQTSGKDIILLIVSR